MRVLEAGAELENSRVKISAERMETGRSNRRIWGGKQIVAFGTEAVQIEAVRRTIDLDKELERELKHVVSLTREKPAVVIRHALRAGLPVVANRFQVTRPEGYFASDYPRPKDRLELEAAMAKVKQRPDR